MQRSFLLSSPRATASAPLAARPEAPGLETAARFGEPSDELAALRAGAALLDLSDAGLVRVLGDEAGAFLERLLANHVRALAPGAANESLLLTPAGGVRAGFALLCETPGRYALRTPPGCAAALAAALETYRFRETLAIEDASASSAPLALAGPGAADAARRALGEEPPTPGRWSSVDGGRVVLWRAAAGTPGGPALWLDAGADGVARLWDALTAAGARPVGLAAREVARLEAGVPLLGADVDEDVYPQEAGLAHAFALDKGCYVGQEVVAKLDTYGGPKRRLAGWRLADERPVARGTPVATDALAEAGHVSSWVRSPALGAGLALGFVKLRALRGRPAFRIGERAAEPVELPLAAARGA